MKSSLVILGLLVWSLSASALEPVDRFHCTHEEVDLKIDIYATGHPMGGVGMYTGYIEVRFTNGLREVVHFKASASERKTDAYKMTGESADIYSNRYTLYFKELPGSNKVTLADLKIEDIGPFPRRAKEISNLDCTTAKSKSLFVLK